MDAKTAESWAFLRHAQKLDELAPKIMTALTATDPINDQVPTYGFRLAAGDAFSIVAAAHRIELIGEYRHVFTGEGDARQIWGAIQFRRFDGDDANGEVLHSVYFDTMGNCSVSGEKQLRDMLIGPYEHEIANTRHRLRVKLVQIIQGLIESI